MPTGYTSDIYDGKKVSAKEFILKCSRAFGANASIRDEGMNIDIPIYEPSDFYLKAIERTKLRIQELSLKTDSEIQKEIDDNYNKRVQESEKAIKKKLDLKNKYEEVLKDVLSWIPPTPEHENLKSYAIKQLEDSIEFDCDTIYYEQEIEKESAEDYKKNKMNWLKESLVRDIESNQKEINKTHERNEWNKNLKDSLNNFQ